LTIYCAKSDQTVKVDCYGIVGELLTDKNPLMCAKMAGRPKNTIESDPVHASLPKPAIRCLELLLESGRYGTNVSDVARYLLMRSIDDLTRANILPLSITDDES